MTGKRKRLGELVLRTKNTQEMVAFYQNVIGLDIYAQFGSATFLKVDEDFEGHPQLLAIFDKTHAFSGPLNMQPAAADSASGTLHHFAFVLDSGDFDTERDRLLKNGIDVQYAEHKSFGWKSVYLYDPDGNSVEFVSFEKALLDQEANKRLKY